jgi:hypothetical protein
MPGVGLIRWRSTKCGGRTCRNKPLRVARQDSCTFEKETVLVLLTAAITCAYPNRHEDPFGPRRIGKRWNTHNAPHKAIFHWSVTTMSTSNAISLPAAVDKAERPNRHQTSNVDRAADLVSTTEPQSEHSTIARSDCIANLLPARYYGQIPCRLTGSLLRC